VAPDRIELRTSGAATTWFLTKAACAAGRAP